MKNLLTLTLSLLLIPMVQAQVLPTMMSSSADVTDAPVETPVESYWMIKSMDPVNYNTVLESITYDARAVTAGLEGTVLVSVVVDENGHYFDHEIIHEAHPILVEAVEKKIHHLRFPKPELQGESVSALVTVPFRFRLTDGW